MSHASSGSATVPLPGIRPVKPGDMPALRAVIDAAGLFPSEMLDGMTAGHFGGGQDSQVWLTYDEAEPMALAYCAPERMTEGTWNLYLIAVHPAHQGSGRGTALLRHLERTLVEAGGRVLLVETSGLPEFGRTRDFYGKNGFEEEARIREFYDAGEDKIIYWKALGTAASS